MGPFSVSPNFSVNGQGPAVDSAGQIDRARMTKSDQSCADPSTAQSMMTVDHELSLLRREFRFPVSDLGQGAEERVREAAVIPFLLLADIDEQGRRFGSEPSLNFAGLELSHASVRRMTRPAFCSRRWTSSMIK